jgi:Acetoacetate decarboxylase (ADC)
MDTRFLAAAALSLASCVTVPSGFYDSAPLGDPILGSCVWSGRYRSPVVYTESDHIRGYFEPANLAAYRAAIGAAFAMPQRPLIRVSVIDFYGMEYGPIYRESEISVLVLHEGQPGWLVLTMPVTDGDACGGGRMALGTPKVMRRITLEREATRYVGTSYARGGEATDFKLTLDVGEPGAAARELLRFVAPASEIYILNGRVVKYPGLRRPIYELEGLVPDIWTVRLGQVRLEYPRAADNLLHRLGVGAPIAAFWGRMHLRYSITPR